MFVALDRLITRFFPGNLSLNHFSQLNQTHPLRRTKPSCRGLKSSQFMLDCSPALLKFLFYVSHPIKKTINHPMNFPDRTSYNVPEIWVYLNQVSASMVNVDRRASTRVLAVKRKSFACLTSKTVKL